MDSLEFVSLLDDDRYIVSAGTKSLDRCQNGTGKYCSVEVDVELFQRMVWGYIWRGANVGIGEWSLVGNLQQVLSGDEYAVEVVRKTVELLDLHQRPPGKMLSDVRFDTVKTLTTFPCVLHIGDFLSLRRSTGFDLVASMLRRSFRSREGFLVIEAAGASHVV